VLSQGVLVCVFDQEEGQNSFITGLSAATGETLWRKPRKSPANWSTPIAVKSDGREVVLVTGSNQVVAYDPKSGGEVWSAPGVEGNAVPSPVSGFDMVFPSAGYPTKRAFGMKLNGSGDRVVWKYEKGTAYVPSPILYGEHLYIPTDRGLLTCLEARTGKVIYEGKRVPKPATFSASPVAYDGKLLMTSEDGETFVIRAGAEHEVLRTNSIGEPVHASPAIANGRVYIRGNQHLYAIGAPAAR
jgi:outer membrane protein assembly factor BamB